MSVTNFSAASSAFTSISTGSASTGAATTTIYSNARAAVGVAKAASAGNSIAMTAYASAAPPHILNQVKNMYYNYPQGGYMEPPEMSLAIQCAIGAFIVGVGATARYRRFRPEDIPPGEDPHTWPHQLEQATNFLEEAANENPLLHRDLNQAREQILQVMQPVDHARRTERTAQEQHKDIWKSCLQCEAHDYEAQIWRDKVRGLQKELARYPDLDQQLINSKEQMARLRRVNNRLEVEKESVEMDFDIKFDEMETQLKNEKEVVMAQLNTANENLNTLQQHLKGVQEERDQLAGLAESLKDSNGRPSDLSNLLQLKEEEVQKLQDRLQREDANVNDLFKQNQELQNTLDALQEQGALHIQKIIKRNRFLKGELEEAHQHADGLHSILERQDAIIQKKEDALEEKDNSLEQKDAALKQAHAEIAELKKMMEDHKEIEELSEVELTASKQECEELQGKLTSTEADRDGERNKRIEYETKVKQLTDSLMTAVAERDNERKLRENLETANRDVDDIRMGLVAERNQERQKSKDLEEQIKTMKRDFSAPSPIPQQSHPRLDSRQSSHRATTPSDRSVKSSVSGSSHKLRISMSASHAHKSPFLDVAPSDLSVVLQAANGDEIAIETVNTSSQQQELAAHSPASSLMGQVTQQDSLPPATPAIPASQDQPTSPSPNSLLDSTPSRKRPRTTELGPEAGPVTDDDETISSRVKRSRKIASPHNRDSASPPPPSPTVTTTNNNDNDASMEDVAPSIPSSQVPTLDLTNAPTFVRPDTVLPSIEVPATPTTSTSPSRRSRLPVAGRASPTRASTRVTKNKYESYNEAAMVRASSPVKDTGREVSVPAADAASTQQSEGGARARGRSPAKKGTARNAGGRQASPKKTTGLRVGLRGSVEGRWD